MLEGYLFALPQFVSYIANMGAILSFVLAFVKLTQKAVDFIEVVSGAGDGSPGKFMQVYQYIAGKLSSAAGLAVDVMDRLGPRYGLDEMAEDSLGATRLRRRSQRQRLSTANLSNNTQPASGPSHPQRRAWRAWFVGLTIVYVLVQIGLGVFHYQSAAGPVTEKNAEYARIRQGCIENPMRYSMPKSKCGEADAWADRSPSPFFAGVSAAWNNMRLLIFTSLPMLSFKETAVLVGMCITIAVLVSMVVNVVSHVMRGFMILVGYTDRDIADMMAPEEEEHEDASGHDMDHHPPPRAEPPSASHSPDIVNRTTEDHIISSAPDTLGATREEEQPRPQSTWSPDSHRVHATGYDATPTIISNPPYDASWAQPAYDTSSQFLRARMNRQVTGH